MPDEIRLLSNLTELRLDGNQLVKFPLKYPLLIPYAS